MDKKETIKKIDLYLATLGLKKNKNYTWSLRGGPTLNYLGESSQFKSLTVGDVKKIKEMGAGLLVKI